MTETVVTAPPDRTVRQIAEMMRERNVGSVVLIDDQRPVGFLTDRDLTVSVLADGRDLGDHAADHASSPGDHRERGDAGRGGRRADGAATACGGW